VYQTHVVTTPKVSLAAEVLSLGRVLCKCFRSEYEPIAWHMRCEEDAASTSQTQEA